MDIKESILHSLSQKFHIKDISKITIGELERISKELKLTTEEMQYIFLKQKPSLYHSSLIY